MCRFTVWGLAAAMVCLVFHPGLAQVRVLQEVIREANIDEAVAFAKTVRYEGRKYLVIKELADIVNASANEEVKLKAILAMANLMLYTQHGLVKAEELLEEFRPALANANPALQAQADYLQGLIHYVHSQISTRSLDTIRQDLESQGAGGGEEDPFLTMAKASFERAAAFPETEGGQSAQNALTALRQPGSLAALDFFFDMAMLFDEDAQRDTWTAAKQYGHVIRAFELGEALDVISAPGYPTNQGIETITKVSQAYFKLHRYEDALGVNELGTGLFQTTLQSHELKLNRAYIFKYNNRYQEAENEYDEILQNYPLEESVRDKTQLKLAQVLLAQEKTSRALTILDQVRRTTKNPAYSRYANDLMGAVISNSNNNNN
ncbi:MAG: tetratricopeptide repeat protein [bacterium]